GGLVDCWATRADDGRVDVLVWNATPDASLFRGVPELERPVSVVVTGLAAGRYAVHQARIDNDHSNIAAHVGADLEWPDEAGWARLRAANTLDESRLPDARVARADDELTFD